MFKKLFTTPLLLVTCLIVFAQHPDAETKELVKQKQTEMLKRMSLQLQGDNKEKVKFGDSENSKQFIFKENLIEKRLDIKSTELGKVFTKMCKKYVPSVFTYEDINVGKITDDKDKKGKPTGAVLVPISFQTHTIAKDNVSDVRYDVTFSWKVGKNDRVSFESSTVKKIDFLKSEKKSMLNAAKDAIVEWYATLPQTLDTQYSKQSLSEIQPIEITADDVNANLPNSQSFSITNVKDIEINIDPYRFIIDSEKDLYTNPTATLKITPTFNITADKSFKKVDISVEYSVKEIKPKKDLKPTTPDERITKRDAAEATIAKLAKELSLYVSSCDEKQKSNIQNMFNSNDGNVEFSYLFPNGTERINSKKAPQYLSLLKGESLNFIDYTIDDVDDNWERVVYIVNQDFKSKTYSDYTQKKVYLTYDAEKKSYYIDKIEVVPNSTKKQ